MENTKKSEPARAARLAKMRAMQDEGATLEQIGETYGISRERVRQILGNRGRLYRYQRLCGLLREAKQEDWKSIIAAHGYSSQTIYKVRRDGITPLAIDK